jgi:hypothetical protein
VTELGETTGTITRDLSCVYCGYNLRTLAVAGRCPECGEPVATSLCERPFRFRNPGTAKDIRNGLVLLIVGVLLNAVCNIALTPIIRLFYAIPRGAYRSTVLGIGHTIALAHVLMVLGLIVATWPFGRRGDRFLWPVGVAVAVLGAACAIPSIVEHVQGWLATGGPTYWTGVFWWVAPSARESTFLLTLVLVWVHLLARVRFKRNRGLWLAMAGLLVIQALLFACSVSQLVSMIDRIKYMTVSAGIITIRPTGPVFRGVSLASLLGVSPHRIIGVVWIITVAPLWLYLRRLQPAERRTPALPASGMPWLCEHWASAS